MTALAPALPIERLLLKEGASKLDRAGRAEATWKAYDRDWRAICLWAETRGCTPLPLSAEDLRQALEDWEAEGLAVRTIERRLAVVSNVHRAAGLLPPNTAPIVQLRWRGLRNTKARGEGAEPLRIGHLLAIVETLPRAGLVCSPLIDWRDRAILLLGWAAALRRSELAALRVADLRLEATHAELTIRRSKTGLDQRVIVHRRARVCPLEAVAHWLSVAPPAGPETPIFRTLTSGGIGVSDRAIDGRDVCRTVKRQVARIGLDPSRFSGHSLRSGLVVSAREGGASEFSILTVTRHKSLSGLLPYLEKAARLSEDPGAKAGLC